MSDPKIDLSKETLDNNELWEKILDYLLNYFPS